MKIGERATYVDTGRVRLAFWNRPLNEIHRLARGAAVAGRCSEKQGRFWDWHDAVFGGATALDSMALRQVAIGLGLNSVAFDRCINGAEAGQEVDEETRAATALGIRGTPAFVIGRPQRDGSVAAAHVFSGLRPLTSFKTVLDEVLRNPK